MIEFTCNGCGRRFSVPDHFAGRRAKCKACGARVAVPYAEEVLHVPAVSGATAASPNAAEETYPEGRADTRQVQGRDSAPVVKRMGPPLSVVLPPPTPRQQPAEVVAATAGPPGTSPRTPVRMRRLGADARQMALTFVHFPLINVRAVAGDPPESYQVEYLVRGVERLNGRGPVIRERHVVQIQLTSEYPRQAPKCKMLTPVFHPNIDTSTICVGEQWTAGERLVDLVIRIGEMIAYQNYNIKSPLNAGAAMWADLHAKDLPVDSRSLRPSDAE